MTYCVIGNVKERNRKMRSVAILFGTRIAWCSGRTDGRKKSSRELTLKGFASNEPSE